MNRALACLALWSCLGNAAAEEQAPPAPVPVEAGKPDAPKAELNWPAPPKEGPLLGRVEFVDGEAFAKTWVEVKDKGAWVVHEGERYWYLRERIARITYLDEAPDDALMKSLAEAEAARKAEEERQRLSDEARAKLEAEKAAAEAQAVGEAAAMGANAAPASAPETGDAKGPKGQEAREAGKGKPAGSGSTAGPTLTANTTGNGTGGGGSGKGPGLTREEENLLARVLEWRVVDKDKENGTVTLRNRGFKKDITLQLDDPSDLSSLHRGQILFGALNNEDPALKAKSGAEIGFQPIMPVPPARPMP
ncbi:MAG: hypothetical protein M5U26_19375 [Planctomycetota bacterium]|nr:hypothetical protein [Planctomycetota bacterium]